MPAQTFASGADEFKTLLSGSNARLYMQLGHYLYHFDIGHFMTHLATQLANGRDALRRKTSLNASNFFEGIKLSDCVIKDISKTGMQLFIPRIAWLPVHFQISSQPFQTPLPVRTIWQRGESVGVMIVVKDGE